MTITELTTKALERPKQQWDVSFKFTVRMEADSKEEAEEKTVKATRLAMEAAYNVGTILIETEEL